jgi:hypothetical protein
MAPYWRITECPTFDSTNSLRSNAGFRPLGRHAVRRPFKNRIPCPKRTCPVSQKKSHRRTSKMPSNRQGVSQRNIDSTVSTVLTDLEKRVAIQAYRRPKFRARRGPRLIFSVCLPSLGLCREQRQGYANVTRVSHLSAMRSGRDGCTARPVQERIKRELGLSARRSMVPVSAGMAKTGHPNSPKRPRKVRRLHPQSRRQQRLAVEKSARAMPECHWEMLLQGALPCALRRSLCRDPAPSAKG